jgi:Novel toxin 21
VRIDRSDLTDGPDDARMARRALSTPDDPGVAGKDIGKAANEDGPPDSPLARPDSATRTERTTAYRANVDAVNRQYAIDHGYARVEKPEREPVTPAKHSIEAKGPEPRRSGGYDVGPCTPTLVHDYDLPEGYTSSPALKRDPYHPDSVAVRSAGNQELYAATSRDRADALGYTTRIPAQKAPFDSHGQEVFTNGKNYITPDVDGHNVTDGWKMFSRRGERIGTYDSELNYVKE